MFSLHDLPLPSSSDVRRALVRVALVRFGSVAWIEEALGWTPDAWTPLFAWGDAALADVFPRRAERHERIQRAISEGYRRKGRTR